MDLEASTSSSPPPADISTINVATDDKRLRRSRRRHPPNGGVRRRSTRTRTRTEIREPNTRSRVRLQGTAAAAAKLDIPAHVGIQRAAYEAARELGPGSSSSTLSNNAGGDSISISVAGENGGVLAGDDGGGRAEEFVDEEAIFNMPLLVDCMAEGMLLTPPSMKKGFSWSEDDDGVFQFNLWQH